MRVKNRDFTCMTGIWIFIAKITFTDKPPIPMQKKTKAHEMLHLDSRFLKTG